MDVCVKAGSNPLEIRSGRPFRQEVQQWVALLAVPRSHSCTVDSIRISADCALYSVPLGSEQGWALQTKTDGFYRSALRGSPELHLDMQQNECIMVGQKDFLSRLGFERMWYVLIVQKWACFAFEDGRDSIFSFLFFP